MYFLILFLFSFLVQEQELKDIYAFSKYLVIHVFPDYSYQKLVVEKKKNPKAQNSERNHFSLHGAVQTPIPYNGIKFI